MRFQLVLKPLRDRQQLLFNYQYPLQAWIYKLLDRADSGYASFLHEKGYSLPNGHKFFKHFTFSSLIIPNIKKPRPGDSCMVLRSSEISLIVSFYIDQAAESFIVGLFQNQQLSLYNKDYQADFIVERVETIPVNIPEGMAPTVRLRTLSPMVIAEKIENLDQYLHPEDERFAIFLAQNVVDKYLSVQENGGLAMDAVTAQQLVKFRLLPEQKIKQRGMLVKEGKEGKQTKVIGFHNFEFELTAPRQILEVAIASGIGKYSSTLGCGCVEIAVVIKQR
ncbi:CRISPR-associated endoribonuclease Cas6 [Dyadobacter sp. LHD-138]|uniref:CRISPR-associated endoribonuclease Cas6 n=1 Tax=Dyadobacter sp. LHD-138 TaxID=3071413 RepID=UPI0027E0BE9D|nr:CRISPR-associated endoribonuclease Cas6 [Dyadobacter sp. LHD-138]MDQ6477259.1 CRISPR-associated endoribonuclease Cas6 [Dyadobacter sp. LHD-138]